MNLTTQIGALELGHVAIGFDDGALEAAVSFSANPATAHWRPGLIPCLNDGALEAAVQSVAQSPTHRFPDGYCR